jgi:hypothetical protein
VTQEHILFYLFFLTIVVLKHEADSLFKPSLTIYWYSSMKPDRKSLKNWKGKWDERIELLSYRGYNWSWDDIVDEFKRRGVVKKNRDSWPRDQNRTESRVSIVFIQVPAIAANSCNLIDTVHNQCRYSRPRESNISSCAGFHRSRAGRHRRGESPGRLC